MKLALGQHGAQKSKRARHAASRARAPGWGKPLLLGATLGCWSCFGILGGFFWGLGGLLDLLGDLDDPHLGQTKRAATISPLVVGFEHKDALATGEYAASP